MSKNIGLRPAREIKPCARRKKLETGGGQGVAPFPRQHDVQTRLELMQIQHVGGGVGHLRV